MHARSSNCQLNDAKHMDYFVATTLFRDAPRFVSDDSKRSRASRTRPDPLGTGKIIIHPELWWHKFLAGWEKCQCLFDPYNLSYRSLELDRFSYIYIYRCSRVSVSCQRKISISPSLPSKKFGEKDFIQHSLLAFKGIVERIDKFSLCYRSERIT